MARTKTPASPLDVAPAGEALAIPVVPERVDDRLAVKIARGRRLTKDHLSFLIRGQGE